MLFPVRNGRLTRDSMGDPREGHRHEGQDIPAPWNSPIQAAMPGRVSRIMADASRACGYGVALDDSAGIRWTYCHMKRPPNHLQLGQEIDQGDFLGLVGSTGSSTGPHLHIQAFTDYGNGRAINLYRLLVEARNAPPQALARPAPRPRAPLLDAYDGGPGLGDAATLSPRALALIAKVKRNRERGQRGPEARATARALRRELAAVGDGGPPTGPALSRAITELNTVASHWTWGPTVLEHARNSSQPEIVLERLRSVREMTRRNMRELLQAARAHYTAGHMELAQRSYALAVRRWADFIRQETRMGGEVVNASPGWGENLDRFWSGAGDAISSGIEAITPSTSTLWLAAAGLAAFLLLR